MHAVGSIQHADLIKYLLHAIKISFYRFYTGFKSKFLSKFTSKI